MPDSPETAQWRELFVLPGALPPVTLDATGEQPSALWLSSSSAGKDLLLTSVAGTDTIAAGWRALDHAMVIGGATKRFVAVLGAFDGGLPVLQALELDGGRAGNPVVVDERAAGAEIAAVMGPAGQPVFAWGTDGETQMRVGLSGGGDAGVVPGCCGAHPALAVDEDGSVILAGVGEDGGLWSMTVMPADDARFAVPESRSTSGAARYVLSGGPAASRVYLLYCVDSCSELRLWAHGARPGQSPILLVSPGPVQAMAAGPAPGGRVWVSWTTADSMYVTRVAPEGTVGGAVVTSAALPEPHVSSGALAIDGAQGPLTVIFAARRGSHYVVWKRVAWPALGIVPPAMPPPLDVDGEFSVLIHDSGEPVAGARVSALGTTLTTSADGFARFSLPAGVQHDSIVVRAAAPGYQDAGLVLYGSRP